MISIRYTTEIDPKLPLASGFDTAALALAKIYALSLTENLSDIELTSQTMDLLTNKILGSEYVEPENITKVQAKGSVPVVLVAYILAKALENADEIDEFMKTYTPWPYETAFVSTKIKFREVLSALVEYGNKNVSVPLLKILQLAHKEAKYQKYPKITNMLVVSYLLSFYASFDERFQAVFYPAPYRSLSTRDGSLFETSSMLARGSDATKIDLVTATSAWMFMMVQEPVPSLMQDFLVKSHRSTKIAGEDEDDTPNPLEEEPYSLEDICKLYVEEFLPSKGAAAKLSSQQTIELIVADSITPWTPAAIDALGVSMLSNSGKDVDEVEEWLFYCGLVEESVRERAQYEVASYPTMVTLDERARTFMLEASQHMDCNHRALMASSAFVKFLDESLQGGAPDLVTLSLEDICVGAMALDVPVAKYLEDDEDIACIAKHANTTSRDEDDTIQENETDTRLAKRGTSSIIKLDNADQALTYCGIDDDDRRTFELDSINESELELIKRTRRLSHFAVPPVFQRLLLANMVIDNRAVVSIDDLIAVHTPGEMLEATMMLANTIDPFIVHAGVSDNAMTVLALAETLQRRALMSLPMGENSANRVYSNMMTCALSAFYGVDGTCCGELENWKVSMSQQPFDPRTEVAFFLDTGETSMISSFQSSVPMASQQAPSGSRRRNKKTANMSHDEVLDAYTHDMVSEAREGRIGREIIGRDEEITLIETILSRKDKSNPLLLAPAGAGKTALVEAVAKRIADGTTSLPDGTALRSFDLIALTSDGCGPGIMADRLEKICTAAADSNTILFIDEIHMINSVGSGDFNAANILKPCLARTGLHIIGATTEREYNYSIARDKALSRRFSAMHLHSLEFSDIVAILERKAGIYGSFHDTSYQDGSAQLIALLAQDYMSDRESPDRELDILDTSASVAAANNAEIVTEEHIVQAVKMLTSNRSVKTRHEIAKDLVAGEKTEEELDKLFPNVAGQKKAKAAIAKRINESKLDISVREKPKSIMMFVGESGVGKTYMAQQMLPLLDATEDDLLELYLTEYQDSASMTRLVGASPQYVGYNEGGVLTNFVKAHPSGVIVLNEIDKSHEDIQQLFLGVFDNGVLRAGDGSVADCKSITFICTANTGFGASKKNTLGFATNAQTEENERRDVMEALKADFGEPLIGRLDDIVMFDSLTADDMVDICKINYRRLREKMENRYGVDIADAYPIEELVKDATEKFESMSQKELDARTGWKSFEDKIKPLAIALMK